MVVRSSFVANLSHRLRVNISLTRSSVLLTLGYFFFQKPIVSMNDTLSAALGLDQSCYTISVIKGGNESCTLSVVKKNDVTYNDFGGRHPPIPMPGSYFDDQCKI
jgi:hypothetical protein